MDRVLQVVLDRHLDEPEAKRLVAWAKGAIDRKVSPGRVKKGVMGRGTTAWTQDPLAKYLGSLAA